MVKTWANIKIKIDQINQKFSVLTILCISGSLT
jgi:hypothetical protein